MKSTKSAIPNPILKQERELRGWSQSFVAEQIGAPNSYYISRWECGTASPSPYYREKLCRLFEKNTYELGLTHIAEARKSVADKTEVVNTLEVEKPVTDIFSHIDVPSEQPKPRVSDDDQSEDYRNDFINRDARPAYEREKLSTVPPPSFKQEGGRQLPFLFAMYNRKRTLIVVACAALLCTILVTGVISFSRLFVQASPVATSCTWPQIKGIRRQPQTKVVQYMLQAHGYSVGKSGADGMYGPNTEDAIRSFQRTRSLPVTGEVDAATWKMLILPAQIGQKGSHVKALQYQLNTAFGSKKLTIDGDFSDPTKQVLQSFQQSHQLSADGTANLSTWCLLVGGKQE